MNNHVRLILGDWIVPPESDITIKIDFQEGEGSAARVFDIAANLIRAFEDLDRVLVSSVDSRISTTLILEDIEKSSLLVFLRNILKATDDQALKEMDWKQQVGKYLVAGKYIALEWLDQKIDETNPPQIEDLTERIQKLAAHTDVRHLPDYPPINPARLAQPLDEIQRAKGQFKEGEKLTITLDKSEYEVHLDEQWLPSEHLPEESAERELSNDADMVLVIRKADFLGKSQWQFRHGTSGISAPIEDLDWLNEFHQGKHPLTPGAALRVRARFQYKYDARGDLIEQKITIIKVYGIIPAALAPEGFFDDE